VIPHYHADSGPVDLGFGSTLLQAAMDLDRKMAALPTDAKARKATPIFTGCLMYFPAVWGEVAKVSVLGNQQHNPGEPLHWERGKSTDQTDSALRHMIDHGAGNIRDTDGTYHLAKAIWRLCAELQLTIEKESKA
jgi:hypothetical protein